MKSCKTAISLCFTGCLMANSLPAVAACGDTTLPNQSRLATYITTHFTATGGDKAPRGDDEEGHFAPYIGNDADLRWMNLDKDLHPFNDYIAPAYNNYNNQVTAYNAVKVNVNGFGEPQNDRDCDMVPDEIEDYANAVFDATGVHVDILNYNPNAPVDSYILENHPNVQIVNNVIYGTSLFTVFLPPYWNKEGKYPVKLSGQGGASDNNTMYLNQETRDAFLAAMSNSPRIGGGKGLIVIRSNTGGRESGGVHSNAVHDVGEFLQNVMVNYGADLDNIVTDGESRAGMTAVTWGVNPENYNYKSVAIYPRVTALMDITSGPLYSPASYPSINRVINNKLGSHRAHAFNYVDVDQVPPYVLSHRDKILQVRKSISGSVDENYYAPYASTYFSDSTLLPELRKKRVLTASGTRDSYIPISYQLAFNDLMEQNDAPQRSIIGYGFGHEFFDPTTDLTKTLIKLVKGEKVTPFSGNETIMFMPSTLEKTSGGTAAVKPIQVTNALIDKIKTNKGFENYFPENQDENTLGFSATIPHKVMQSQPLSIVLMGEEGASWEVMVRPEDGYQPVYQKSGWFGPHTVAEGSGLKTEYKYGVSETGKEYTVITLWANVDPGRYEWFFKYNGKEIPNRFTPYLESPNAMGTPVTAKAVTEVTNYEPDLNDYFHPESKGGRSNMGIDQFHPWLLRENNAPVLNAPSSLAMAVGETINIKFSATDEDGDTVVYDLRNADTDQLLESSKLNGLTGEVSFTASIDLVGHHLIKAIAKDGKGGIAEQVFSLTVTDVSVNN